MLNIREAFKTSSYTPNRRTRMHLNHQKLPTFSYHKIYSRLIVTSFITINRGYTFSPIFSQGGRVPHAFYQHFGSKTNICGCLVDFRFFFGGHVLLLEPVRVGLDTHPFGGFFDPELYVRDISSTWE